MIRSVHPVVLIAIVGAVLAVAALVAAGFVKRWVERLALFGLALMFLAPAGFVFAAFHPEVVDGRFRTYKAFYGDLAPGMTREQVLATLDKHYPASGPRRRPKIMNDSAVGLGFFMDPETSREPNCEGIFLDLYDGRVTRKRYSAD